MSVDHVPCLKAWAESLGGITYPLLSDFWPHGKAARSWGVFREGDGHAERAVFVLDRDGIVRYAHVHDIEELPDIEVVFEQLSRLEAPRGPAAQPPPDAGETAGVAREDAPAAADASQRGHRLTTRHDVVMYCTPWCPDCRGARRWLEARGVDYVEIDVTKDAEARRRAAGFNEGRLHTPTFEIDGDVCIDFRPERLARMLGLD